MNKTLDNFSFIIIIVLIVFATHNSSRIISKTIKFPTITATKMRSTFSHMKSLSTVRKQTTQRKSNKFKHERISSMMQYFCVKGNEASCNVEIRNLKDTGDGRDECMQEVVEREFQGLRGRIRKYCEKVDKRFVQHERMQKLIRSSNGQMNRGLREQDVMKSFMQRITQFLNQRDQSIIHMSIKKLQFPSSIQNSLKSTANKQLTATINGTNSTEKIETIEVMPLQNRNKVDSKSQKKVNTFIKSEGKKLQASCVKVQLTEKILPNVQIDYMNSTVEKLAPPDIINSLPISCSSTVSQLLYLQAKHKNFAEFHQFCQKILLQKKPVISDVKYFEKQKLQKTNHHLNQIYNKLKLLNDKLSASKIENSSFKKELNFFPSKKINITEEIQNICLVLKRLNELHNLKSLSLNCQRPCCQFQHPFPNNPNKAKILINLKSSPKRSIHYKTQATEDYFNRYYKNENFDVSKVYSLTKTKTEEMEALEKTYYRKSDKSRKCKKRCQSLYENFDSFA